MMASAVRVLRELERPLGVVSGLEHGQPSCRLEPGEDGVKIQGESQVLGLPIADETVARWDASSRWTAHPQDPYTATWFVLRLNGLRRRWRAVPAQLAGWTVADGTLRIRLKHEIVLTSPSLSCPSLTAADSRTAVKNFYAQVAVSLP